MLETNNIGRLKELSSHYKQMAGKADHRVANILNELSGHLETYANTKSPKSRSEIIDCRNRIEKTRQTGDTRYLQKGYVPQKNSGNNNPRAGWEMRRGRRAVGESWSMNLDDDTSNYFVEYHSIGHHMLKNPEVKDLAKKILNEYARFKKTDISMSPKGDDNLAITGCLVNIVNCVKKMMYVFIDIRDKMESGTAIRNRAIAGRSPGEGMRRANDEQTDTFNSETSKMIVRIHNKLLDSIDILRKGSLLSEGDITEITLSVKDAVTFARRFV